MTTAQHIYDLRGAAGNGYILMMASVLLVLIFIAGSGAGYAVRSWHSRRRRERARLYMAYAHSAAPAKPSLKCPGRASNDVPKRQLQL